MKCDEIFTYSFIPFLGTHLQVRHVYRFMLDGSNDTDSPFRGLLILPTILGIYEFQKYKMADGRNFENR